MVTALLLVIASLLVFVSTISEASAQKPRDRMLPAWKIDSSELKTKHIFRIWCLEDTTSTFEGDTDTNIVGILRDAKANHHKRNSGLREFYIDSTSGIFNPSKFKVSLTPSLDDYNIQDTMFMTIEVLDTTVTAYFGAVMIDSAGNQWGASIYLHSTPSGLTLLRTVPSMRYYDLISPYWRLDTADLRTHHTFELVAIDDTVTSPTDTSQIAKAIRKQLIDRRPSHRGNSGLMELYPMQYYLGYDPSAFKITLSSWDRYKITDTMRMTFEWLDTTATGFFRIVIVDSSGQGIGTEPYFLIAPADAALGVTIEADSNFSQSHCFPNPAHDQIRFNLEGNVAVEILSVEGIPLLRGQSNAGLDVSNLQSGRYIVKVGSRSHPLIIVR